MQLYWVDGLAPPDPRRNPNRIECLVDRFRRTADDFGFGQRWWIVVARGGRHHGMTPEELESVVRRAELRVNISGHLPAGSLLRG